MGKEAKEQTILSIYQISGLRPSAFGLPTFCYEDGSATRLLVPRTP